MPDWDKSYREAGEPLFGEAPTDFVRAVAARPDFDVRRALCLADGDGRNGRWLASRGIAVTAVDISAVATEQARVRDAAAGLSVHRVVADLTDWEPVESDGWDAVFVIFLQCPSAIRNRAIAKACARLSPGGWFVAEGFARHRSVRGKLGPSDADLLYDIPELELACSGLKLLEAMQGEVWLQEGTRHRGYGDVVRLVSRRLPN
jgi:SAM-dependent methyltransferase